MIKRRQFKIIIVFLNILFIITLYFSFNLFKHKSIEEISHIDGFTDEHDINNHNFDEYDSDSQIINNQGYPFTIVTAVSSNHFCALQSWLYYMKGIVNSIPTLKRPRIIIYDIGLVNYQRKWINVLLEKNYLTEFRRFEFERYPTFWKIDKFTRGEYGWKPGIISEIIRDYPGPTLWLDSGTYVAPRFLKRFNSILNYYNGFFSPVSDGYMLKWTHQGVFDYFNDDPSKYENCTNCSGGAIAFDSNKVKSLMNDWVECARIKQCIAPEGSNRTNHRQDQAILTYLAAKEKRFCTKSVDFFGIKFQMDGLCEKNVYFYEKLNNITWSPTAEDLIEIKMAKRFKGHVYDIWNTGAKVKMLKKIHEKDYKIFNYDFNLIL